MSVVNGLLAGKVGLVTGIANERSVAAGCAHAFRNAGAEPVLTCREKSRSFVVPVAKAIKPRLLLPLDVEIDGAPNVFSTKFKAHSGAWISSSTPSPKQDFHGRVTDCSREGFARL